MTLVDRVVLVTGTKRIGGVVARELARHGAHVALSYNRSRDEADEAAAMVRMMGRRAEAFRANLSEEQDCQLLVDEVGTRFGRVDALVNMASVYASTPFDALEPAAWHRALAVDLHATFFCSRAVVPHMRKAGGGRIVNFTDWVARSGRPRYLGFTAYYVAKAGVIALTEALALELAKDNILVNAIAPGPIVPPPGTSEEELKEVAEATPLGRWGGEQEIAKAVVSLIETDFITGETIRVDGGRHLK
jgi:NAD(P)-dependent dehydrogenase (short-subunit alcohol dehydrogenase family)